MEIRTYGVEGFMDWQCEIPVGRARAIVHFTGGTMTSYGVTPAEYSTGDPVQQRIIENSAYFKNGRIKFLRKTGKPDPVKRREPKPAPAPAPVQTPAPTPQAEAPAPAKPAEATPEAPTQEGENVGSEADVDAFIEQTVAEAEEEAPEAVEVSCLTDAQNYLRDHFGIPTSKSRSKEKAQDFARENGIVFVGL